MIALDASLFIYLFEAHPEFGQVTKSIFESVIRGSTRANASELVYLELLSRKNMSAAESVRIVEGLLTLGVELSAISSDVLQRAASLRREWGLGAMDSIHVASAIETGCDYFVTNDYRLLNKSVDDITLVPLGQAHKLLA